MTVTTTAHSTTDPTTDPYVDMFRTEAMSSTPAFTDAATALVWLSDEKQAKFLYGRNPSSLEQVRNALSVPAKAEMGLAKMSFDYLNQLAWEAMSRVGIPMSQRKNMVSKYRETDPGEARNAVLAEILDLVATAEAKASTELTEKTDVIDQIRVILADEDFMASKPTLFEGMDATIQSVRDGGKPNLGGQAGLRGTLSHLRNSRDLFQKKEGMRARFEAEAAEKPAVIEEILEILGDSACQMLLLPTPFPEMDETIRLVLAGETDSLGLGGVNGLRGTRNHLRKQEERVFGTGDAPVAAPKSSKGRDPRKAQKSAADKAIRAGMQQPKGQKPNFFQKK